MPSCLYGSKARPVDGHVVAAMITHDAMCFSHNKIYELLKLKSFQHIFGDEWQNWMELPPDRNELRAFKGPFCEWMPSLASIEYPPSFSAWWIRPCGRPQEVKPCGSFWDFLECNYWDFFFLDPLFATSLRLTEAHQLNQRALNTLVDSSNLFDEPRISSHSRNVQVIHSFTKITVKIMRKWLQSTDLCEPMDLDIASLEITLMADGIRCGMHIVRLSISFMSDFPIEFDLFDNFAFSKCGKCGKMWKNVEKCGKCFNWKTRTITLSNPVLECARQRSIWCSLSITFHPTEPTMCVGFFSLPLSLSVLYLTRFFSIVMIIIIIFLIISNVSLCRETANKIL